MIFKWENNYIFLDIMDDKIYSRNRFRLPKIIIQNNMDPKKQRNASKVTKIVVILIIAISVATIGINGIQPIIEENCKSIARSVATKVSNIKATEVMAKYEYDDILEISKDQNGNITRVGTNIFTINKIISDIPVYIQEELEREENSKFKIPLGSFLGSKLFSGMGPKVNIKIQMVGDIQTDLRSEFSTAGINQTLHRIYLEIKCNVVILTPFKTIQEEISNQVLIAEGVIVGEIPNTYYNLDGITKDNAIDIIE